MSTIYYLIDTTKPQTAGFITSMESVHKSGANQAELSVSYNVAGDRALVKVKGDQSKLQKPDPQNVILEEYTEQQRDLIFAFIYSPAWMTDSL